MAPTPEAQLTLNEIVTNARRRRKNQDFATSFFDKSRRASAPAASTIVAPSVPGSLSSRVSKPSTAPKKLFKQLHKPTPRPASASVSPPSGPRATLGARNGSGYRSQPAPKPQAGPGASFRAGSSPKVGGSGGSAARGGRHSKESLMAAALASHDQVEVHDGRTDFSVKGIASGPAVVLGSNFAPGTTAADIESALEPVGGTMLSCSLMVTYPSVVAEMTFADRSGAEAVVSTFNNQKADGRVLHVRIKPTAGTNGSGSPVTQRRYDSYDDLRSRADRERRENRLADNIQDGRYGFADPALGYGNGQKYGFGQGYGHRSRRGGRNGHGDGSSYGYGNGVGRPRRGFNDYTMMTE